MIKAECHSDDRVVEVDFDAQPWFSQATDDAVSKLAHCDWGGDYPADEVAQFCTDYDGEIERMFDHINNMQHSRMKDPPGFECHVDEHEAMNWLKTNRQSAFERICAEKEYDPADYEAAPAPGV